MKRIDEWEVSKDGKIRHILDESKPDRLFAVNEKGERTTSMAIKERSIMDQLTKSITMPYYDSEGTHTMDFNYHTSVTSNENELGNIFLFLANNTDVEWSFSSALIDNSPQYGIASYGMENVTPFAFKDNILKSTVHSHVNTTTFESEIVGMSGDKLTAHRKEYNYYVYIKNSTRLYHINQSSGKILLQGKLKNYNDLKSLMK